MMRFSLSDDKIPFIIRIRNNLHMGNRKKEAGAFYKLNVSIN